MSGEGGHGPSVPSFVLVFFYLGQGKVSHNKQERDVRRIMMTERTMTIPESPNCVTRLLFVYIVRHAVRPRRVHCTDI